MLILVGFELFYHVGIARKQKHHLKCCCAVAELEYDAVMMAGRGCYSLQLLQCLLFSVNCFGVTLLFKLVEACSMHTINCLC